MEFKRTEDGRPEKFPVGMRVLAVDDNATCLKLLEVMLLRCKYHVTKTMEPKKAVEILRENSNMFDLVITDVHMPDTDGFKLLEIGLEMDLPVIMLSGPSDYDSVMKGITHGACDYLIKPVRVEELKNIWQHVVKKNFKSYAKNIGPPSRQLLPPSESDNVPSYSKKRKEKVNDDHSDREEDDAEGSGARKKPRVVWPQELHQKFDKKKITWTIKNFSSLPADPIFSDDFFVRGCKWHLKAYPKGKNVADYLSMCLCVADSTTSLPSGWRRRTKCRFTIVNQISHKLSDSYLIELGFDENLRGWGRNSKFPLKVIYAKDSGFLLNGELKIVVEIEVLEVIGKLDVTEETSTITEIVDINGFELSPAQAKSVSRLFERHPEIASDFRPKNSNLKTGYMSLLLGLIETMIQLPQEMSKDDLLDAYVALGLMRGAGFKLDWLEKKLYELSVKKEESSEAGLQGMEEELREIKMKCADMEALVEKKKAKVSVSKAHISFDDIV